MGFETLEVRIVLASGATNVLSSTANVLDPGFGVDGASAIPLDAYTNAAAALDSTGRIIAAGTNEITRGSVTSGEFAVIRDLADGTPDQHFGHAGVVTTDFGDNMDATLRAIVVQPDNKIVVVGDVNETHVEIVRYNVDGSLDTSFNHTGIVTAGVATNTAVSVQLQSDGRLVVAGNAKGGGFTLQRYQPSGSLDKTFGNAGLVQMFGGDATALRIQVDGKLVLAEGAQVFRFLEDGAPDRNFGSSGAATYPFPRPEPGGGPNHLDRYDATFNNLALQPDGSIVVSGPASQEYGSFGTFQTAFQTIVIRFNTNGLVDNSFGFHGLSSFDFETFYSSLGVDANGRIVISGAEGVLRLNSDGSQDSTIGANGTVFFGDQGDATGIGHGSVGIVTDASNYTSWVTVLDGSSIIVAGENVVLRLTGGDADLPMYRLYLDSSHPGGGTHYYTTNQSEFNALVGAGWQDETTTGAGFTIHATQILGTLPVHMLYNPNNGEHYYTVSDFERDALVQLGWQFHRDEGFMYPIVPGGTRPAGTTEVLRLYNQKFGGDHLFLDDPQSAQNVLLQFRGIWVTQSSLGYAGDFDASVQSAFVSPPTADPVASANHAAEQPVADDFVAANTSSRESGVASRSRPATSGSPNDAGIETHDIHSDAHEWRLPVTPPTPAADESDRMRLASTNSFVVESSPAFDSCLDDFWTASTHPLASASLSGN